jgi:hypothetical protein
MPAQKPASRSDTESNPGRTYRAEAPSSNIDRTENDSPSQHRNPDRIATVFGQQGELQPNSPVEVDPLVLQHTTDPRLPRQHSTSRIRMKTPKCRQKLTATRWKPIEAVARKPRVPLCLSSGADGILGGVVTAFLVGEHDPPYVRGDTSFQAAYCFVSGFAFSDLLVEVASPGTVGHPDLCDCHEMECRVQLPIAAS